MKISAAIDGLLGSNATTDSAIAGATVTTLTTERLVGQGNDGSEVHRFATLDEAVRFVMMVLPPDQRHQSFVSTAEGPLCFDEFERRHREAEQTRNAAARTEDAGAGGPAASQVA